MASNGIFGKKSAPAAQSAPMASDDSQSGQSAPKDISSDPQAMQLVDQLKSMGYSGQEVEKAMDGDDQQQQPQDGQAATQAAPLQIPGM